MCVIGDRKMTLGSVVGTGPCLSVHDAGIRAGTRLRTRLRRAGTRPYTHNHYSMHVVGRPDLAPKPPPGAIRCHVLRARVFVYSVSCGLRAVFLHPFLPKRPGRSQPYNTAGPAI